MNLYPLFTYEFVANHEFIHKFMKKTYEFGGTKDSEGFSYEFIYINSYMNSYSSK